MLEQEIAGAIKFILENSGNPAPYYYCVPQDFLVPAVYFPKPEIMSGGDTLLTYALEHSWFINFFHKDTQSAYELGLNVLKALQRKKNVIPLIDEKGAYTGHGFRTRDPSLKPLECAAQLTLIWSSPRPYDRETGPITEKFDFNIHSRTAYNSAVRQLGGTQ
jgi:hypothetical protein